MEQALETVPASTASSLPARSPEAEASLLRSLDRAPDQGVTELSSGLPDLTQLTLTDLLSHDDSVLRTALERLLNEADSHDVVAGFTSAI